MVARSRTEDQVKATLMVAEEADASPEDKAEMLMQIAMGLQTKPQAVSDLEAALQLYRIALDVCPAEQALLSARIRARAGTALMAIPSDDGSAMVQARESFEVALGSLTAEGLDEEIAEAEMNLGLALQNLAGMGKALIQDSISAYQRALRTFDKERHPKEYAILQNNLATAFLSIPFADERSKMREALAVQAFEDGLSVVTLIDHPAEYAMLQNNLGNALQYVSSSHRVENGFRALEAYDEALKVRDPRNAPGEYANTIANKANCLANLPDDPARPEVGNPGKTAEAVGLYREAAEIFETLGEADKAETVRAVIADLEAETLSQQRPANGAA